MSPNETICEKPIPSASAQSMIDEMMALIATATPATPVLPEYG